MQRNTFLSIVLFVGLASAIGNPRGASAVEPAREFLNELRAAHLYDMAIEYLDRVKDSPLVPAEFKETLAYERGVTMVKGAASQKDYGIREKQLDEAQNVLRDFIANQPKNTLVSAANNELGNLLVQRAGMRIERTKKGPGVSQKATLLKEARVMYDEALKLFAAMEAEIKVKLESMPKALDPKTNAKQIELRDQLRADYLQTQILAAAVKEEMADTEAKGSKGYNDLLLAAAKDYNSVYEKYRTRLAGLYARLYQGRCYVKMNNHKEAMSYFSDLLDQPDQPQEFRDLKVKTLLMAVECWFSGSPKKYDDAIKRIGPFLDSARPDEQKKEDFLALKLWLAKAYKALGDDLNAREPGKKVEITKAMTEAKKLANYVAKIDSDVKEEAVKLVASIRGVEDAPEEKAEPKNFAEAKEAGKEALEAMQTASFSITELPKTIATEKDPAVKAELEKQLAEAKEAVETNRADAFKYYRMALRMANSETSRDDVNIIQYFLCFLHYNMGDYYESALLGEFVARRSSESSGARQCAKIAMASYLKIYKDVQGEDKSFETGRIVSIAEYIVSKWPNEPEAIEAINTLIPFMIRENKLDEAQGYLTKIPEEAAPRGEAELKIGQSLWSTYLYGMQSLRKREQEGVAAEAELKTEKTRLEDVKKRAEKTLTDGVARMQKSGEVSATVATAVLSLGQIYVDTNQADKAVALLEDEKIGALMLVQKKDPAISKEGLPEETIKTALRAYISSLPTSKDANATVKKAKDMMDALKATTGATPEGQKKLVSIYVSLAKDLQAQMDIAPADVKKSLSKGFEAFLKEVGAGATEMNVLNWVAETFYGIATSFTDKGALSPEAKKYYEEADATFSKMLKRAETDKTFLSPQMNTQVRHRLAMTKRALGQYKEAIDMFEAILREHNSMLNVQIEAARTYQEWGAKGAEVKPRAEYYALAMAGAKPDEKKRNENVIWGWGMLAKRTAKDEQYRDTFFEARYNLAVSRFRQAELYKKDDKEKHEKVMKFAKQDVRLTRSQYPDLGGAKWEPQYNDILKKVQTALGEKSLGLAGLPAVEVESKPLAIKSPEPPKKEPVKAGKPSEAVAKADSPKPAASSISAFVVIPLIVVGLVGSIVFAVFFAKRGRRSKLPHGAPAHADLSKLVS